MIIKKRFMVIGLGRFGANVAKTLASMNCDVLAMDVKEESVEAVAKDVAHCVIADATKMNVLVELGAANIDHAVVAIGNNLEASILTVVNLKNIGVPKITVRADNEEYKKIFSLIGATEVVIPEEESAISLAHQIRSASILDYYIIKNDYVMAQIKVSTKQLEGKTLKELDVRNTFNVNILGITRKGEFFIPAWNDMILESDVVAIVGKNSDVRKVDNFLNEQSGILFK